MNRIIVLIISLFMLFMAGCSSIEVQSESRVNEEEKSSIVTTFYPVEEITKNIVGDLSNVNVIVKAGVEPHSFEPTLPQVVEFSKADVFVKMGGFFKHIEEEIVEANKNIKVIDPTHNLELIKGEEHEHHEHHHEKEEEHEEGHKEHEEHEESHEEHENHEESEYDPHIWLSVKNMKIMTNEISNQLIEIYPQNKELYEENAKSYLEKLDVLEKEYFNKLTSCRNDKIVVNHKAFGYLAHEYNFEQISVAGFSPETQPTPSTIKKVIDEAKEHNLSYVFSEGQIDSKVADTIAKDISGKVLELNPLKMNDGEDYFSIMRTNLENLAVGLNCE